MFDNFDGCSICLDFPLLRSNLCKECGCKTCLRCSQKHWTDFHQIKAVAPTKAEVATDAAWEKNRENL